MEVGQAINLVKQQENIEKSAFTPIHLYIARLIPYLEQRQEIAKRYRTHGSRNDEAEEQYLNLLKWNEKEISTILNFLSNEK